MDRPSSRRTLRSAGDHHQQRRSHPALQQQQPPLPGTLRGAGGQQQQLTSGGHYSSTDSDTEEGTAVYESLAPVRRPVHSHSAMGPLVGAGEATAIARMYQQQNVFQGTEHTNKWSISKITTNLNLSTVKWTRVK